jgi:hypothetical protein
VFPKHDHLRVEEIVERNTPGALRSPQSRTEPNEPWPIRCATCVAILHAHGLSVRSRSRQRRGRAGESGILPGSVEGLLPVDPLPPRNSFRQAAEKRRLAALPSPASSAQASRWRSSLTPSKIQTGEGKSKSRIRCIITNNYER